MTNIEKGGKQPPNPPPPPQSQAYPPSPPSSVRGGNPFGEWLELQLQLQTEAFGIDPPGLRSDARADYATWNSFAAEDELHEAMRELQWKPWANERGEWINRDAFVGEIVDVLHFVGNLLLMAGVQGDELWHRYRAKVNVNIERQRTPGGYDGRKGASGRAYDEPTFEWPTT